MKLVFLLCYTVLLLRYTVLKFPLSPMYFSDSAPLALWGIMSPSLSWRHKDVLCFLLKDREFCFFLIQVFNSSGTYVHVSYKGNTHFMFAFPVLLTPAFHWSVLAFAKLPQTDHLPLASLFYPVGLFFLDANHHWFITPYPFRASRYIWKGKCLIYRLQNCVGGSWTFTCRPGGRGVDHRMRAVL